MIGARSEYRLIHSHASLFVNGQFRSIVSNYLNNYYRENGSYFQNNSVNGNKHDVRMLVGVKLNFGAHTLIERDRLGASLDPITPMLDGITVNNNY